MPIVMYGFRKQGEKELRADSVEGVLLLLPNICLANDLAAKVLSNTGEVLIPTAVTVSILGE